MFENTIECPACGGTAEHLGGGMYVCLDCGRHFAM